MNQEDRSFGEDGLRQPEPPCHHVPDAPAAPGDDRRFRLLFENFADPMLLLDPVSGVFIEWNPAAVRMLRYPDRSEVAELTPADISPLRQPDDRASAEKAAAMIAIALRNGSHRFEWNVCSRYRDEFPVEVLLTSFDLDGRQALITTWRDLTYQKQGERKLHDSEVRWKFAIEGSGDGLWDWNIQRGNVFFSRRWKETIGYSEDEIGTGLSEWSSRVHPDDLVRVTADVNAHLTGAAPLYISEFRFRAKDGEYRWILARGKVIGFDEFGKPLRMVGTHTDVTEQRRVLAELERAEFGHRALLNAMVDGVFVAQDFSFVFANPALPQMLGYTLEEFVGRRFDQVVHPDFIDLWDARFRQRIAGGDTLPERQYELRFLRKGGTDAIWIELIASRFVYQGAPAVLGIVRNIGDKKKNEEIIWRQANYDALTQLPNRHMLLDRLALEIRKSRRTGQPMAVLFIDLDRFKEINDTLGHHLGDQLLQQAAQRLLSCLRDIDLVARLGGDEFTVVIAGLDNRDGAERVAQNILEALQQPFMLEEEQVYVTASVGITFYPDDADCIEDLLKQADQAMYDAKHLGRNRLSYFTPSMQARAEKRMRLVSDMHVAIEKNQFCLVFQPIVELATGRTRKAEALIRWNHPDKGVISPADFIPIAEETGLILPMGDWVTRASLSYLNKFDIDYLKIDRSFVQGLAPLSSEQALCEAMIVMAHKLGIEVIAEGVETVEQRDLLINAGCDYAQGYYFARPLAPEAFEAFVAPWA